MTRAQTGPPTAGACVGGRAAAVRLGVTERTILRWSEDGTLPVAYRTRGGHRRYRVRDVEEVIAKARDYYPEDDAAS